MEVNTRVTKRKQARRINNNIADVKPVLPQDYTWKILGWLVDDLSEILHQDDAELVQTIVRDRDFDSYMCLSKVWGLPSINSQSILTLEQIKAKYALASLSKKFQFSTSKEARVDSAKQKFINAEDACASYNRGGYMALAAGRTEQIAGILTDARAFLRKLLGETCPTLKQIMSSSRHGPGANLDTEQGLKSAYDKYANWPYSCTGRALPYARFLIQTDKRWLGALEDSYRRRYNIPTHVILDQVSFWQNVFKVVPGNRITFVPKDALTERSIAIEPAMNLMLQLGVENHIRSRLKRYDIDLDSQEKNQRLARQGSVDGSYATIDLAAASDSMSLKLVELLLPEDWYDYLCKLRSPEGVITGGVRIIYEKISSMGNGYTFALESAIFAAICYAVICSIKGSNVDFVEDFTVFGDDIIIKTEYVDLLYATLPLFGFSVNADKSFVEGPVRESCGTDWYKGEPIRPVFLKQIPTDIKGLFTDINRIKRLLSLRFGIEKSKTEERMVKWIPEIYQEFKGPKSNEDFDSYHHVDSFKGFEYIHGAWEYKRLVYKPRERLCRDFHFRKLMHDLKPFERPRFFEKVQSGGSRFMVTDHKDPTICSTVSRADFWREEYADQVVLH